MGIRPLILMDKNQDKAGMVVSLFGLALSAAFYPILLGPRRFIFYMGLLGFIFTFVCFCFSYWMNPNKNKVVFKMDESGVCFHNKESHSFEWSELKQVSVRFVTYEKGKKTRLLFFTTQDDTDYCFNIFKYVVSYVWTIQCLKKSVPYFSKGSVPFKYYSIWNKSFNHN